MKLVVVDYIIILVYFIAVLGFGFYSKKNKTATQYLLVSRKLTLPFFVATLVATWYGLILGIGEFVYSQGIVAWICMGLPFYGAAILFSIFIAGKIRSSNIISIPDMFHHRFGKISGQIASILVLIVSIPAAYILMLGVLLQMILGLELYYAIILGAVLSISPLFSGGFETDVKTNTMQFVLMYVGFGALLLFCVTTYGSPTGMISVLPSSHLFIFGNNSWQVVCTWFIIALQTFIDPSFHQRSAAATTPSVAKKGILISVGFWILFDFLTITTGLYARAFINTEAIMSFPALGAEVLPQVWRGLFAVTLLATVMSSLNSYAFLSAITIGNDILFQLIKRKNATYWVRIGLVVSTLIGILLAILLPSAVQLIYKTASIAVPGLLIPILIGYSKTNILSQIQIIIIMVCASTLSLLWMFIPFIDLLPKNILDFIISVEPMIPGIVLSIVLYSIFAFSHTLKRAV